MAFRAQRAPGKGDWDSQPLLRGQGLGVDGRNPSRALLSKPEACRVPRPPGLPTCLHTDLTWCGWVKPGGSEGRVGQVGAGTAPGCRMSVCCEGQCSQECRPPAGRWSGRQTPHISYTFWGVRGPACKVTVLFCRNRTLHSRQWGHHDRPAPACCGTCEARQDPGPQPRVDLGAPVSALTT